MMKRKKFIILPILALLATWLPAQDPCSGIPANLTVANQNITTATDYKAQKEIVVGPAVNITQAVDVNFTAQESITFTADFTMVSGATMEAKLANPCASLSAELYPWVDGDAPKVSGQGESFPWVDAPENNPWIEDPKGGDGKVGAFPWVDTPEANPWLDDPEFDPWALEEPEANPWLDDPEFDPWALEGRLAAYPNPFVDETKVSFRLKRSEMVTVQIYSLDGEFLASLYKGKVSAGEAVTLSFSARDLPAGLYMVRLITAAGFSASQRLMLQR